jgi:DNA ligase-1
MVVKPMLAAAVTPDQLASLVYPLILQVKYDGIRGLCYDGGIYSRSGKPLPNGYVQKFFWDLQALMPESAMLDGELIVGNPNDPAVCMNTTSGIMSQGGRPNFTFYAFDFADPTKHYGERRIHLMKFMEGLSDGFADRIKLAPEFYVTAADQVEYHMSQFISQNLEGCILRHPHGLYKNGRSTLKQQWLLKLKDIADDEAIVVGFEQLQRNLNEAHTDELGFTKRSSHQGNKMPDNLLGALVVVSPKWSGTFRIGTGFDVASREQIWGSRQDYLHRIVKFKYLKAGMKDLPRHPVFLQWRHATDVSLETYRGLMSSLANFKGN